MDSERKTTAYGTNPAVDPLAEMAQLAHAVEVGGYAWTDADVVRAKDPISALTVGPCAGGKQ